MVKPAQMYRFVEKNSRYGLIYFFAIVYVRIILEQVSYFLSKLVSCAPEPNKTSSDILCKSN